MLIKKAYSGEFKHLLSILRGAVRDDRCYVTFAKKKFNYLFILNYLQQHGFIEGYEERGELLTVTLKQTYWKSFQYPLKAFNEIETFRSNKHKTVTAKRLKKVQYLGGQSSHFIISSDRGIISGFRASNTNVGGIPLFKIY